ncbi:MAG TPA: aldo/keto reductase [Bacteroidota bacterium]|nr:aldo/keto reductase [Bacteroidota bacterium]
MEQRELGKSGITVSALGLGCMGMSQSYGPANEEESVATLLRAVGIGVTLFDTADVYGLGANELLVGKVLGPLRNRVRIATKFGIVRANDGKITGVNGSPAYVRQACEASLTRLGVETIDLYYAHRVDPQTPVEETVGAMARLVEEGKVRLLGLSEASARTIRRACSVHPITALQSEYSLWTRDIESDVMPVCRELGVTIVPFSPLGRGFLSGAIRTTGGFGDGDFRKGNPRFEEGNFEKNLALLKRIEALAAQKKCTPAQLALAWVMAQGKDIVPIPGTKRRKYLEENAGALNVHLTPADLAEINTIAPRGAAAGERYTPEMMRAVDK